jgi:hypothetical protein
MWNVRLFWSVKIRLDQSKKSVLLLNYLLAMKKSTPILMSCVLAIGYSTSVFAAPKGCALKSLIFNCLSKGPITIVAVRSNRTYGATSNAGSLADGTYQFGGTAYRFTSGGLKDKSIFWKEGKVYLVDTQAEGNAAELAKSDGALVCVRS